MKADELKICGLAAVRARFARDAASIQRLYFDYATGRKIGMMCKALAAAKKIYRCVEPAELEKIAGTVHHGGVVAVVPAPQPAAPSDADIARWAAKHTPLLLLDRIGNAHNLGALARTAGFFGITHVVIPLHSQAAQLSEAAYRVAEGGLDAIDVFRVKDLAAFAAALARGGYEVVGGATRGGRPEVVRHGPSAKPIALVLGNEEHGLSPEVAAACTQTITIPGTGAVESLNVSVAAAVLMWELFGRREKKPADARAALRHDSSHP